MVPVQDNRELAGAEGSCSCLNLHVYCAWFMTGGASLSIFAVGGEHFINSLHWFTVACKL